MIEELDVNRLLRNPNYSVYEGEDAYTLQQLLYQFYKTINQCVDSSNKSLTFLEWLKDEGLQNETKKLFEEWKLDGTWETIINSELFSNLNSKIDGKLDEIIFENFKHQDEIDKNEINETITNIKKTQESEKYILQEGDDLQEILNTKKNIFIPNSFEIEIRGALKTGMDGQTIEGNNTIIRNLSTLTDVVRNKVVSLHVRHKNVTLKGLKIIGDQRYNASNNKEDISTGHGIYIPSLPNANTLIENCEIINGYNGISVEEGSSYVTINNCTIWNCEHGVQIHRGRHVVINNHTHKVAPYGSSFGYTQRCIKVQGGGGDVILNNAVLEMGRVCSFYIRNEVGNTEDIKNISLNNITLKNGTSSISDYAPYTAIYLEHEGESTFENIKIDGVQGDTKNTCIMISKTASGHIKNLTISNVINKSESGRTVGFKTGLASQGCVENLVLNNIIGNDLSINAKGGVISNIITNSVIAGPAQDVLSQNIVYPNCYKPLKTYIQNGVMGEVNKIPYPTGLSQNSITILSLQVKNTNGAWISTTFNCVSSGITFGNHYNGNDYRMVYATN